MADWYKKSVEETLEKLETNKDKGLSDEIAKSRLKDYGKNRIKKQSGRSAWKIFWSQFASIMIVVLIVAAVIMAFLGEITDTIVIAVILVLNTVLGFFQEYRAEKAMQALKKLSVPEVTVKRDGKFKKIKSVDLVPGDIVLLEAGSHVSADVRIIEASKLKIQESALTGESEPVTKNSEKIDREIDSLGDHTNMAYSGTFVTYGRGVGVVTKTGMNTEIGKIATMIQEVEKEDTPLQKRLEKLGKWLVVVVLAIAAVVFILGLLRGQDLKTMFLAGVSLAIAAVPESMPAVVTIALALGARRMLKKNALVRRLNAVETLGSVNTICSDKTGTITENRMQLTLVKTYSKEFDIDIDEEINLEEYSSNDSSMLSMILLAGGLCNDSTFTDDSEILGDPTEGALLEAAKIVRLDKDNLERILPRVAENPFDSDRKRMTTVHRINNSIDEKNSYLKKVLTKFGVNNYIALAKGAVDNLLEACTEIAIDGEINSLTEEYREKISEQNKEMAGDGYRVLGIAFKNVEKNQFSETEGIEEKGFCFLGMVGLIDPPRDDVKESVKVAKNAGVRSIMITGDHPLTAFSVAKEVGIAENEDEVISGDELNDISDEELKEIVKTHSVFARVNPDHKLRLVKILQDIGQTIAMTGDGVNDSPALKKADIGVAMGINGTDVSKEASEMVLLDDDYSTIVDAVKEGRTMFDNLKKFIRYMLGSNFGEIWTMLIGPFMGLTLPLLPLQILWINLITDGLPALALSVEPPEEDVMNRPPNPVSKSVLGKGGWTVALIGALLAAVSLTVGIVYRSLNNEAWRTMIFTTLVFSQLFCAPSIRTKLSIFKDPPWKNPSMMWALVASFLLQIAVIYVPFLQQTFGTVPLAFIDLLIAFALSSIIIWVFEIVKLFNKSPF
jgi:Ca2+-transporting ATPase